MNATRVIGLVLMGLGLVHGDLNDPDLYVADYYPQPQSQPQPQLQSQSEPQPNPYHYRYRYHYHMPSIDEEDYVRSDEPGYFVDYPIPTQYNNRALDKNVLEFLEKNGLQKNDPSDILNKRVLSSFRERMEREKSKEQQEKLAEMFLQKLEEEAEDRELEREYDNRDYIEMIEDLWEKYKNSQYDKDAPVFVDEVKKRQIEIPTDYSTLGWSGVGYRKRTPTATDFDVFGVDVDGDRPVRYHFIKPQTSEVYNSYPTEFLYAKRKRFPVAKRSSNFYAFGVPEHHNKANKKLLVGASGTDPKVVQDLGQIFGNKKNTTEPVFNTKSSNVVYEKRSGNKKTASSTAATAAPTPPVKSTSVASVESNTEHSHASGHTHSHHKKAEQLNAHTDNGFVKDEPLNIKKKSIDWSNYFGIDRRKKKSQSFSNDNKIDNDWLIQRYNKAVEMAVKRTSEYPLNIFRNHNLKMESDLPEVNENLHRNRKLEAKSDETKLRDMDDKLKNIEDLIIDEALKYTGAHEGETDPSEIQEVKDKVISRLAAAYSLEKMRRALSEFKSNLGAQKYENGNYRPSPSTETESEVETESEPDEAMKKKSTEEERKCVLKLGCNDIETAPSSGGERCNMIENRCQRLINGGYSGLFYSLCKWHQQCYLCQDDVDVATCDSVFLSRANALCRADVVCQWAARPALIYLRQLQDAAPHCDRTAVCSR